MGWDGAELSPWTRRSLCRPLAPATVGLVDLVCMHMHMPRPRPNLYRSLASFSIGGLRQPAAACVHGSVQLMVNQSQMLALHCQHHPSSIYLQPAPWTLAIAISSPGRSCFLTFKLHAFPLLLLWKSYKLYMGGTHALPSISNQLISRSIG